MSTPNNTRRPSHWQYSCAICKEDHPLKTCKKYLLLRPSERYEAVCQHFYCISCLARSHNKSKCLTAHVCKYCNKKHHTSLHDAPQLHMTKINPTKPFNWAKVFRPTVMLRIANRVEEWSSVRAVITKMPFSRIAASTQHRLQLNVVHYKNDKFAKFHVATLTQTNKWSAIIHAKLTTTLPKQPYEKPIEEDPTVDFARDSLADPDPRNNTPYDLELGADVLHLIYRNRSLSTNFKNVIAEYTAFGYTFTGPVCDLF